MSNLDEAIAYTATYMVVNIMMQNYLYGSLRWPWISELYEYCQGVFLSKALVAVFISPASRHSTSPRRAVARQRSPLRIGMAVLRHLLACCLSVSSPRSGVTSRSRLSPNSWSSSACGTSSNARRRRGAGRGRRTQAARPSSAPWHQAAGLPACERRRGAGRDRRCVGGRLLGIAIVGKAPFDLRAGETEGLVTIEPGQRHRRAQRGASCRLRHTNALGRSSRLWLRVPGLSGATTTF